MTNANEPEHISIPVVSQPGQEAQVEDTRPEPRDATHERSRAKPRTVPTQITEQNEGSFSAPMIVIDAAAPVRREKNPETWRVPTHVVTDHSGFKGEQSAPVTLPVVDNGGAGTTTEVENVLLPETVQKEKQ